MRFKWEDNLMVGVEQIDDEHKELIEQANKLFDTLGRPEESTKEIMATVDFLEQYVVKHFRSEERLQKKYHYPELDSHHKIHEDFKAAIGELKSDIKVNGLSTKKKIEVNKMLIEWLNHHIGIEDKKLGKYINQQK